MTRRQSSRASPHYHPPAVVYRCAVLSRKRKKRISASRLPAVAALTDVVRAVHRSAGSIFNGFDEWRAVLYLAMTSPFATNS